jgi:hypothetical protein
MTPLDSATSHCRRVIKTATDMLSALSSISGIDAVIVVPIVSVDEPRILITPEFAHDAEEVRTIANQISAALLSTSDEPSFQDWTKDDESGAWVLSRRFTIDQTTIIFVIHTQLPSRVPARNL